MSGPHDVPLPVDRLAVEAGLLWFLQPARPFSFDGGWNGVATQNMVLATPYYIYSYYCLRLIGSDSGPTRRMGNVNGLGCQWFATIGGLGRQRLRVFCLLYTSPSPRDGLLSRMPSSA